MRADDDAAFGDVRPCRDADENTKHDLEHERGDALERVEYKTDEEGFVGALFPGMPVPGVSEAGIRAWSSMTKKKLSSFGAGASPSSPLEILPRTPAMCALSHRYVEGMVVPPAIPLCTAGCSPAIRLRALDGRSSRAIDKAGAITWTTQSMVPCCCS